MYVRKSLAGAVTVAVTGSVLAFTAGTAHAAVDPDDTTFTPTAVDFIGVGSDTSQNAVKRLADSYNATVAAGAPRLASYAATGGGTITLPSGAVTRPNGSGNGKKALYGAGNNPDVDFARASNSVGDPANTAEVAAGLQQFPFALDTLKLAVSNQVPSNAPATITPQQMVGIYKGDIKNWSQIDPTKSGVIEPKIPQGGSGTRSFFVAQLKQANENVDVTLGADVKEVQEHDATPIRSNPNAIAPFSAGRAGLAGTALRLTGGFSADRALYNVVRGADLGNATTQALFGPSGYFCSDDATDEIEAAGFKQLARAPRGACGSATQTTTTNFITNEPVAPVATRVTVTGVSPSAKALRVTARVSGSPVPTGTVQFFDGAASLGTKPLIGGAATLNLTNRAPKAYAIRAVYTPTADSAFVASSGAGTVKVKAASSITETFAASFARKVKAAKGVVAVKLGGTSVAPTGKVVIKKGAKTVGTGTLKAGKVTITLAKAKVGKGKSTLKITWAGDGNGFGSSKSFTITFKK